MKFYEAVLNMKPGDMFVPDDSGKCGFRLLPDGAFETETGQTRMRLHKDHLNLTGKIIKSKPEPVSFDDFWQAEKKAETRAWCNSEEMAATDIWTVSAQNTHLLYDDLMEICCGVVIAVHWPELEREIEKIKQHRDK